MTSKTRKSTYRSLLKQAFLLAHYWCKYPANRIYIKGSLPDKLLLEILQKDVLDRIVLSKIIFLLFHSMARCTCPQFLFWLHRFTFSWSMLRPIWHISTTLLHFTATCFLGVSTSISLAVMIQRLICKELQIEFFF